MTIRSSRYGGVLTGAIAASLLAACDLSISNPGPIADEALDDVAANQAIANGMGRALSRSLGFVAYTGGIVAREIVAAGSQNVGLFGVSFRQREGRLLPDLNETNEHWKFGQQARWVAEDGIRRMRATLGDDFGADRVAAEALVYAGFANRVLGENMCDAVIDGGPRESREVHFERSEAAFTEAITVATAAGSPALAQAARAGRAAARVWLGDWQGAEGDALLITSGFVHRAIYSNLEQAQYNRIFWANANQPARAHSVVGTFYETYFTSTRDPRTPWSTNPAFPKGTMDVLWYFQTKYDRQASPMNLATSREMRLIVAEARLRAGEWQTALSLINSLRAEVGVQPWQASGISETWTVLARERGIELWLEGRRLGDLYRWKVEGVPGQFDDMTGRDLCFPIGISELDANQNL